MNSPKRPFVRALCTLLTLFCLSTLPAARAASFGWSGGGGAGTAWLTPANWTNNAPLPTTNDLVWFGTGGTAAGIQINFNGINVTNTYVGAIVLGTGSTLDRSIGQSGTAGGTALNIATINGGAVSNLVSGRTLTLQPFNGGSGAPMTLNFVSNATFNAAAGASNIVTASIAGTVNITNTGAGQLALLTNNTMTGKMILVGGTLLITNETGLGANPGALTADQLTFAGGTLRTTNNVVLDDANRGVTLAAGGGTITVDTNFTLTVADVITGANALTKTGSGALVLSGNNTYTGTITVNQNGLLLLTGSGTQTGTTLNQTSILRVANSAAFGTGNLTINPNNAETGRLELSNNVSVLSGRVVTLSGRNNTTDAIRNVAGNNTLAGSIGFTTGGSDYRIQSDGGSLILSGGVTSTATAGRVLTLQGNSGGTVSAPIVNGSAVMGLTKAGTGAWTLTAVNPLTGPVNVTAGTLILSGSGAVSNSPGIVVASGAVLATAAVSGGFALETNQALSGAGIVVGPVTVKPGAFLVPGAVLSPGTLTLSNSASLLGGSVLNFDLAPTPLVNSGSNDLLVVNGSLAVGGPVPITLGFPFGPPVLGVPYTLVRYSGTLSGGANLFVTGLSGMTATLDTLSQPGSILVTFAAAAPNGIVWQGDGAGNAWDFLLTPNFTNSLALPTVFSQGDDVRFDDTSANLTVNLVGINLQPATVTVNSANNHTFQGAGSLAGGSLTKAGSGLLTINTANTTPGTITVQGGTLKTGNGAALGSIIGPTFVTNGGSLDLNGQNLGAEEFFASGAGVGGSGVILNSGAGQTQPTRFVTLAGDATFGGTGRWDIRANPTASFGSGGQPYKLTKVGVNQFSIVGAVVDPALGDVDVLEGIFSVETSSTGLGDPTRSVNVASNANLQLWALTTPLNKVVNLTNTARVLNGSGTSTLLGPILLDGTNLFDAASGTTLIVNGPLGGAGALAKMNTGLLILNGTNLHGGGTVISNGGLQATTAGLPGAVTNFGALLINQAFDGTLAGPVTGTGSFLKRGLGRVTITTPMGITGTVTNEAGTLVLGADNVLGTGPIDCRAAGGLFPRFESSDATARTLTNALVISSDTRLGSATSGDLIFSGPANNGGGAKILAVSNAVTTFSSGFNNTGLVVKEGPGQLVLGSSNNNSAITISNGTVALAAGAFFQNNPNMTILPGTVLDVAAAIGGSFNLGSGRTLVAGRTAGFANDITGSLASTGTVTLVAANVPGTLTVSGDYSQTGGTLNFDLAGTTTTGAGVNDFINVGGAVTLAGTIVVNVNPLNNALAAGTYTLISGASLSGTPTFTLNGTNGQRLTASLALAGNNLELTVAGSPLGNALTWLGTNVSPGWDLVTTNWTNTVLGAVDRFFNTDAVLFDNSSTNTNVVLTVTVLPSTVTVDSSSNYTFSGAGLIGGGASIAKSGSGTLALGNANTFVGPVSITGGTLRQSAAGAMGNSSGITVNGGQFDFAGFAPSSRTLTYNISGAGPDGLGAIKNSGANVSASAMSNVTLSANATIGAVGTGGDAGRMDIGQGYGLLNGGGFTLTKVGPGFLNIRSATIDLPEIVVAAGTLYTENIDNNLGAKVTVAPGARLGGTGLRTYTNQVDLANNAVFFTAVGATASTWNGPVNVPAGTVFIGNGTISGGAGAQALRITTPLNGAANLIVASHPLELSADNDATFSGNIGVNATTLRLTNNGTAGSGVITNNAGTVEFNPGATYGFTRTILGPSGTVTKSGTNTLQLAGAGGNQISDGQVLNITGGTFDLNGRDEAVRGLTGSAGSQLTNSSGSLVTLTLTNPSGNHTYLGNISGPLTLLVKNAATHNTTLQSLGNNGVSATVNTNNYTGGTIIDNGQLRVALDLYLGAVPGSPSPGNIIIRNAGALQNNDSFLDLHANRGFLLDGGDAVFGAGPSKDIIINGSLSGPGRLLKGDGGRLVLKNAGTHTGDTAFTNWAGVGQGTLRLDHTLALQNSTFDATGLGGNGTLDLNNMDIVVGMLKGSGATIANFNGRLTAGGNGQNGVFGSTLSGAGSLVKVGGGTLVLTAANNPYNGGTIVSNGILVTLGNLSGAGAVVVKSGATFGSVGSVAGPVVVEPGGTLYPGASPGTLTLSNHLALNSGVLFYELSSQHIAGLGLNDQIDVKSNLTLAGVSSFRFQFLSGTPALGVPYTLIRYAGSLAGDASNLAAPASRYGVTFDTSVPGEIRATFSGAGSNLVWAGSATNNTWNLDTFTNFFNGLALDTFKDGDRVTFDDSGYNGAPVLLAGTLAPVSLVVSNETEDYTFAGPNGLNLFQGFTKRGAARLTLAGTNETIGRIDVLGGSLALSADDNLGAPPLLPSVRLALNGGELEATATLTLHPNRQIAVGPTAGAGSGALEVAAGQTLTVPGVVTNNGPGNATLVKRGAGALALAAANAYSGGTLISKGTVLVRNDNALGAVGLVTLGDAATGTDATGMLLDVVASGNRTLARDLTVSSAGSGPVVIGSTAQTLIPGAGQAQFNGVVTLTSHDLYLRTGAGDFTRFSGDIAGTGNLLITNGSLNGDMRGNSGNRIILEAAIKTFTGDITILAGSIPSPLLTNFTVLQLNTAHMLRDTVNIAVQPNAVLRVNADENINGLSGAGRVRGVVALRTLGVGAASASSLLHAILENDPFDGGSLALTKYGAGTLTLTATNTYTGITTLGGGTLALGANSSFSNSTSLILSNGTTLDASAIAGGFVLMGNQSLVSGGTVMGNLTAATNATLTPGHTNVVGTLAIGGNLALNGNRLNFELDGVPAGPGNDQIAVTGDLALNGLTLVNVTPISALTIGTYRLISYTGTKTAGGLANLSLVMAGTRYTAVLADNPGGIDLVVSAGMGGSLVWNGGFNSGNWDVNAATNWDNGGVLRQAFFNGDIVTFNDVGLTNATVNIPGAVLPASVTLATFSNYVFNGAGRISGTATLTASGTGTNTLNSPNDYTGLSTLNAGLTRLGSATALGSIVSGTVINSGATLDLNGRTGVFEPITVSGAGVFANGVPMGAIVNYGAATANDGLRGLVTLAGDTTIGGANRWDMFGGRLFGNDFKLTKTNTIEIALSNLGETGLGDIDIQQGLLTFLGTTTMGNPAKTVFVYPGATLHFWALNNQLTPLAKNVSLTNATLQAGSGNNFFGGTIQLVTNGILNPNGANIYFNGTVSGDNLTKNGSGIMGLYGVHTHTGSNQLNAGVLSINSLANGGGPSGLGQSSADPTNLTFNGGTLQYVGPNTTTDRGFRLAGAGTLDLTNDVAFSGGFYGAGAFNKTGPGRLTLSADTTNSSGQFQVRQGTLILGNTSQSNTVTGELWVGHGGSPGANVVITGGTNTVSSFLAIARDAGTGDSMLYMTGGRFTAANGSTAFQGASPVGLASIVLSNNAFLNIANSGTPFHGGEVANSRNQIIVDAGATFKVNATAELGQNGSLTGRFSGTIELGVLQLAANNNSTGIVYQTGGTVTQTAAGDARIGGANAGPNALGLYDLSAGTLNLGVNNFQIGANGLGLLNQSGGIVTSGGFAVVGRFPTGVGALNVSGGQFLQAGAGTRLIVGEQGLGTVNVSGSGLLDCAGGLLVGHASGGSGVVNLLAGGVIATPLVERSGGSGTFHFNGGTLRAKVDNATYFQGLSAAFIQNGGAILDNAGFNTTINQALLAGAGAGGLMKLNPGVLTLNGVNTYAGPTFINGGTLALGSSGLINGSPLVSVAAGAFFDVTAKAGYVQPAGQTLAGSGTVLGVVLAGGTVAPGASIGTLTFDSALTLAGTVRSEIDRGAMQTADLVVATSVAYGGTLAVTNLGSAPAVGEVFNLFDATTFSGGFTSYVLPALGPGLYWDTTGLLVNGTLRVGTTAFVVTPPANQTIECSSNANFSVVAGGDAPISYQWFFGLTPVAGATAASVIITNAQAGTYTVQVINAGGTNSASAVLTTTDTFAPTITACVPAQNLTAGANCQGTLPDLTAQVVASDACGAVTVTQSPAPGTLVNFGPTNVIFYVADSASNTSSCIAVITVIDQTAPVITNCFTNLTLVANASCQALMPDVTGASFITAGDSCPGSLTYTQSVALNTLLPLGVSEVVLAAVDAAGNAAYCTNTVTVVDQTPPTITNCAPDQLLAIGGMGTATLPNLTGLVVAGDCGGSITVTQSPLPGVQLGLGIHPVTLYVVDPAGNVAPCLVTVTVTAAPVAPSIDTPPQDLTAECGGPAQFTVVATGSIPLSYQWYYGVSPILNATNAALTLNNVHPSENGNYSVLVTNIAGSVTSSVAVLTVVDTTPPSITCPVVAVTKTTDTNGAAVAFAAPVAVDACSATTSSCLPPSGSLFPVGSSVVTCGATDTSGNSNSCTFAVTVLMAQSVSNFVNAPVPDGSGLGLARTINVASPIGVLTDVNVTLHLTNGWNGDLYAYLVHDSGFSVLLNRVGKRGSDPLGYDDAGFNVLIDDQATNDIHSYRFSLSGSHATPLGGPLTNAWQPDGRVTDPALVLDTDARTALLSSFNGLNPNGEWALFVADLAGGDVSTLVSWGLEFCGTLGVSPAIITPPMSQAVDCGMSVAFTVGVTGTGPLGYHWSFNGSPIPGGGATLTLPFVTAASSGNYSVIVSNAFGSVISPSATLVVNESLPNITAQPQSRTNNVGATATFTVSAISCSALQYQWRFGPNPLPGQTNATLSLPNLQLSDAGNYAVVLANAAGSVTSAVAVLTVNQLPIARDNGAATTANLALAMPIAKLLANDNDPDGDPVSFASAGATSTNGGAVVVGGGNVTYTPLPGFTGLDRLSYTIADGRGGFATAQVEILVVSGALPSPNQVSITPTPNGFLVRFAGVPGKSYQLQRATTIGGPWSTLVTLVAPLHGIMEYEDTSPPMPSAFYRTVTP